MNNFDSLIKRVKLIDSQILKEYCVNLLVYKKVNYKTRIINYLVNGRKKSNNYNTIMKNFKQKKRYENNIESLIAENIIIKKQDNIELNKGFWKEYLKIKMNNALSDLNEIIKIEY